jgi:hypothetical protein
MGRGSRQSHIASRKDVVPAERKQQIDLRRPPPEAADRTLLDAGQVGIADDQPVQRGGWMRKRLSCPL